MNDIDHLQDQMAQLASNLQSQTTDLTCQLSDQRQMLDEMNSILEKTQAVYGNNEHALRTIQNDLTVLASRLHDHEHLDLDRYEHPDCWTPVTLEEKQPKELFEAQGWLRTTAPGRYDVTYNWQGMTVFFENRSDAVMFKLAFGGAQ